jgi:hypothetical protein
MAFMAVSARSEESQFAYVYTTDLLPKGAMELEQTLTWRHQKSQGEFDDWQGTTAFEYGVTDYFQMALYGNYDKASAYHNDVDGKTVAPERFADLQVDPDERLDALKWVGVSLEGILRLLSPYTDPFGLAVYLEPTWGQGLFELESKLIAQKNFLEDRLILAFNVTMEQELRLEPGDPTADPSSEEAAEHWDHGTDLNFGYAISYRFISNWSLGLELENEREFSSFTLSNEYRSNNATYFGPNIHYGGDHLYVTVAFLEQLPWGDDFSNPPPGYIVDGRNYADDFERYRMRIKAGYSF